MSRDVDRANLRTRVRRVVGDPYAWRARTWISVEGHRQLVAERVFRAMVRPKPRLAPAWIWMLLVRRVLVLKLEEDR